MTPELSEEMRCANPGCPRPIEEGERYCATCGLERSLFRPDARRKAAENRANSGSRAGRR